MPVTVRQLVALAQQSFGLREVRVADGAGQVVPSSQARQDEAKPIRQVNRATQGRFRLHVAVEHAQRGPLRDQRLDRRLRSAIARQLQGSIGGNHSLPVTFLQHVGPSQLRVGPAELRHVTQRQCGTNRRSSVVAASSSR